jgi:hypothetical protein
LHDGSGYYTDDHVDEVHGPEHWGQSVIIDQENIDVPEFGHLGDIGRAIVSTANTNIHEQEHHYHLKNTRTREGDEEMAKTLTYFAINNAKPAFGIEASKSLNKAERVYCHLSVIESFMKYAGIKYTRQFPLEIAGIDKALSDNRQIAFYDNRIFLEMENVRNQLNYFPLYKEKHVDFTSKNPLITIVQADARFDVYHGNEKITTLIPQYFNYDDIKPPTIHMVVDGKKVAVGMGQTVTVENAFEVVPRSGYRANIIGFTPKGGRNESGISIQQKDCLDSYSMNTSGDTFRIEFYKEADPKGSGSEQDEKFAGMVNVKFVSSLAWNTKTSQATTVVPEKPSVPASPPINAR